MRIAKAPSCKPRPNAKNIMALERFFVEKATSIPCAHEPAHGFGGMVEDNRVYHLRTGGEWQYHVNPGVHAPTHDGAGTVLSADAARAAKTTWEANNIAYCSQENVRRAMIDALNDAVDRAYKRSEERMNVGIIAWNITDDPRDIIRGLRTRYGKATPAEKEANDNAFRAPWNPSDPIETLYDRLEECFVFSLVAKPAYNDEQVIDRAITAITTTRLFSQAVIEWNGFDDANKTWPELKSHFADAYTAWTESGRNERPNGLPWCQRRGRGE